MGFTESSLQQACRRWFDCQFPQLSQILIAVPNAQKRDLKVVRTKYGYRTICPSAQRQKDEGLRAGVSDMLLLKPNAYFGCLGIEMKTETIRYENGRARKIRTYQEPAQKEWQKIFEASGNKYVVCRTIDEFIRTVTDYLSDVPQV